MNYRVGKKQGLAILDENGLEVAMCRKGYENVAIEICRVLNNSKYIEQKILEAQIAENESILEMLKVHGDGRSRLVVRCRIIDLQEKLAELTT